EDEDADLYLTAAAGEPSEEEAVEALLREKEVEGGAQNDLDREQPVHASASPNLKSMPSFRVEERGNGRAWLQINQELPWPTALWILQIMKLAGPGCERDTYHRDAT